MIVVTLESMKTGTLAIFGTGLIGGSVGLAARQRGLAGTVLGVGRNLDRLSRAKQQGVLDEVSVDLEQAAARADFMVFCTPVEIIVDQIRSIAPFCRPGCLITDAGSTKAAIVGALEPDWQGEGTFVGSHPLAGSEKQGADFADARLFQGRLTVITPTARTPAAAVEKVRSFWQSLGATVVTMTPEEHDQALAHTSHLPHLLASALAAGLPSDLARLAASGFRDTTRIAAGDPSVWTGIFLQNRHRVLESLREFSAGMQEWQAALEKGDRDAITRLLQRGKQARDALGN